MGSESDFHCKEVAVRPVAAAAGTNAVNAAMETMRNPDIPGFTVRPIALDDALAWAAYICLADVKRHTSSTAENVEDVRREIGSLR